MSTENTKVKIEELNALRRQARVWRIGGTVVSIAVSVIFLLVLRSAAERLFHPGHSRDVFVAELRTNMQEQVVPQVKTLAVRTVNEVTPRVKAEILQLRERTPELAEAVAVELELFQKNIPLRAESALNATLAGVIHEREAKIREMYPDLTEKKVGEVVALLLAEGEKRTTSIANRVSAPYEDAIGKLVADLNYIRDTEPAQVAGTEPSWELAQLCSNMLQDELRRKSPPAYQEFLATAVAESNK